MGFGHHTQNTEKCPASKDRPELIPGKNCDQTANQVGPAYKTQDTPPLGGKPVNIIKAMIAALRFWVIFQAKPIITISSSA